ncbi:two-component system sensor histidine kinase NtrB [Pseudomonas abieticivorans]|uniref:two-component system sensor histidine kinase NtrB n=1 Tax=Pseudomonas abieticivorans TaxID=2931382 RepID=UPI0020BEBFAE|nr:PAS domain-containing sensor histidine kinase [Pseudomonas sp. PIA16]
MDHVDLLHSQALQASRYELLVQAVVDYALYMLDLDGTVITWNPGAEGIKGYRADEVIGQSFSLFFGDEDRAQGKPAQLLQIALREGRCQDEGWRRRKDGTLFWALAVLDVVHDEQGNAIGFAKITRDITSRREADQQLDLVRAQLFQAQKLEALGELTGGLAHDFNNLLTIIIGSANLALNSKKPERVQALLANILEAGARGSQLTQQLLGFARRKQLHVQRVAVGPLIESTQVLFSQTLPKNISLQFDIAAHLPDIEIEPSQLEMVLLNFIFNARDAIDGEGLIVVKADVQHLLGSWENLSGDFVSISVTDNGSGIDTLTQQRIFEPFFTTKPYGKGTGLGLAQAYGFARQVNGGVRVRSAPGQGTTMTLFIPVMADTEPPLADKT